MGLNLNETRENPATTTKEELAKREVSTPVERKLVEHAKSAEDGVTRYSSHPILKYKTGRFRFENGLLELTSEKDVKEFEAILDALPPPERIRIKKLDLSAAEAQVRAVLAQSPHASKRIGSETGDRDPGKQVGKGTLGDSNE